MNRQKSRARERGRSLKKFLAMTAAAMCGLLLGGGSLTAPPAQAVEYEPYDWSLVPSLDITANGVPGLPPDFDKSAVTCSDPTNPSREFTYEWTDGNQFSCHTTITEENHVMQFNVNVNTSSLPADWKLRDTADGSILEHYAGTYMAYSAHFGMWDKGDGSLEKGAAYIHNHDDVAPEDILAISLDFVNQNVDVQYCLNIDMISDTAGHAIPAEVNNLQHNFCFDEAQDNFNLPEWTTVTAADGVWTFDRWEQYLNAGNRWTGANSLKIQQSNIPIGAHWVWTKNEADPDTDSDNDGVLDADDACPTTAGEAPNGCNWANYLSLGYPTVSVFEGTAFNIPPSADGKPIPAGTTFSIADDGGLAGLTIDPDTGVVSAAAPMVDSDAQRWLKVDVTYPDDSHANIEVLIDVEDLKTALLDVDGDGLTNPRNLDNLEDGEDACQSIPGPESNHGCPLANYPSPVAVEQGSSVSVLPITGAPDETGARLLDPETNEPTGHYFLDDGWVVIDDTGKVTVTAEDGATPGLILVKVALVGNRNNMIPMSSRTIAVEVTEKPVEPEPDTDGDGVIDADDKCVNEAGPASNNGCPMVPEPDMVITEWSVTPNAQDPADCSIEPWLVIPEVAGVNFTVKVDGADVTAQVKPNVKFTYGYGHAVDITAAPQEGYAFAQDLVKSWHWDAFTKPENCSSSGKTDGGSTGSKTSNNTENTNSARTGSRGLSDTGSHNAAAGIAAIALIAAGGAAVVARKRRKA